MKVLVNAQEKELPARISLDGLLRELKLDGRPVAVELNRQIVPKSQYPQTTLKDGDRLEIVTFVGGG